MPPSPPRLSIYTNRHDANMPSQGLTILDLPIDILTLILHPLLTTPHPIFLCPCSAPPGLDDPLLTILLIHPALHAIAAPLFHAANIFILDITGEHHAHIRRLLTTTDFFPPALLRCESALRRVHRLTVRLSRLRGWVDASLVPVLQNMVVNGALIHLDLILTAAVPTIDRLLVSGLLGLLADPYLSSSRLRVGRSHAEEWCAFHEGQDCAVTGLERREGRNEAEDKGGLVDIDWRGMVKAVDPEGRELAVAWVEDWATRRRM